MDQLGLFDAGLRRNREHNRRHLIDGSNVQNQLRIRGQLSLSLQSHEDDRRGRGKAFVPSGERIALRRFDDRGTNDAADDFGFGGDQLLAQRFGVGVDIGPTPELRALDPEFR